jgi:hypothetical protein
VTLLLHYQERARKIKNKQWIFGGSLADGMGFASNEQGVPTV